MIAAIEDGKELHIVKWTGRVGLHAGAVTYCGRNENAGAGVVQIPEVVFTQGASFTLEGKKLVPCPRCRAAAQAAIG